MTVSAGVPTGALHGADSPYMDNGVKQITCGYGGNFNGNNGAETDNEANNFIAHF